MATHSSILAWEISWTEEPGGPQSMGSQRVGHNYSDFAHMHEPGKSQDLFSQPLSNMQCNISSYSPTVCYILRTFFFLISFFIYGCIRSSLQPAGFSLVQTCGFGCLAACGSLCSPAALEGGLLTTGEVQKFAPLHPSHPPSIPYLWQPPNLYL